MIDRASKAASVSVLDFEKGRSRVAPDLINPPLTLRDDRRRQKRQKVRRTSLSAHPSLFAFRAAWVGLDFGLCLAAATIVRICIGTASLTSQSIGTCILFASPFAFVVVVLAGARGLYRTGMTASLFVSLTRTIEAVVPAAIGLRILQELWGAKVPSIHSISWKIALSTLSMFSARMIWRRHRDHLYKSRIAIKNFIIVGADEVGRTVRTYLTSRLHAGYKFHGFVSMCEPSDDLRAVSHDQIVGKIHEVIQLAQSRFVDEIIFSKRPATPGVLTQILRQAQPLGISIRLIPSLTETLIDRTDLEYVGDLPTIAVFVVRERPVALLLKRSLDVAVAALASLALLPLFLLIAISIKLQSRGPVLYLSKRVGHKGRVFTCFKFRTMVNNAAAMQKMLEHRNEREGALFKMTNDPRVTPIGRFLRKYSLDELPQLWNVLRGDMSLVGPRPPLDTEAVQYNLEHMRRLDAVPGITGLWQVIARQDPSFERTVNLDRNYIDNWSLLLDLKILMQTVKAVARGTGC